MNNFTEELKLIHLSILKPLKSLEINQTLNVLISNVSIILNRK